MSRSKQRVSLVTGASRGAGMGIAIALGSFGDTVYVTGRSRNEGDSSLPGTIYATANAVTEAGGEGIPLVCDHSDDSSVEDVFKRAGSSIPSPPFCEAAEWRTTAAAPSAWPKAFARK